MLDLVLTVRGVQEESIREVKIGGSLDCSDHALVEFVILKNAGLAKSRARTLCFRRANFQLLKELLSGTPGKLSLRVWIQNRAGSTLRTLFCQHNGSPSPSRRSRAGEAGDCRGCTRTCSLNREKGEMYRKWKQGCVS